MKRRKSERERNGVDLLCVLPDLLRTEETEETQEKAEDWMEEMVETDEREDVESPRPLS
jgi:hypothetical protein